MEIIDQIKQVANIIDIASQYTNLTKRGKNFVGLCPFHSEKTPSFTLDIDRQLYHCFGCGAGGDVFTLVMEKENLSFPEAMRQLAAKYNITIPERKKLSPQFLKLEEKLFNICELALAHFRKNLFNTQEGKRALDYLHKRKISEEVIQQLKIGYALNSWDSLMNSFRDKQISPPLLEKAGLVLKRQNQEGYYDRFRGRVIFPIFTLTGKPVAFGGRTLLDAEPKYLNSPDTPIYTKGKILYGLNFSKEDVRDRGLIFLVEGYTDFLALYQAGIKNCAASLGTSLTADQVSIALRFAPKIITSYDGDIAGKKAALRAISLCFEKGVQVRVMVLPQDSDPDSFLQKHGPDQFKTLAQKSIQGLKYLIDSQVSGKKNGAPEEKAKIIKNILHELEKIPDSIIRSEYIKQTSEYLSLDESLLRSIVKTDSPGIQLPEKREFLTAEKMLLQIIFDDHQIAVQVFKNLDEEDFKGLKSEEIFKVLSKVFREGKELNPHEIKEQMDSSIFSALSKILFEEKQRISLEQALDCVDTLKQYSLQKKLKDLNIQIQNFSKRGEREGLVNALKQKQEITEKLSIFSPRQ